MKTPLITALSRLYIGDGMWFGSRYVERVSDNRYLVNGVSVGGRNTYPETAVYYVAQMLGYDTEPPCSRCGKNRRMAGSSHCQTCRNTIANRCMRRRRGLPL